MAEPRWHHEQQPGALSPGERVLEAERRAGLAEEQRLQAEGRCFAAERRRLDAERRLEQVQRLLREAREAGVRMQALIGDLGEIARHLRGALERPAAATREAPFLAAAAPPTSSDPDSPGERADAERRAEMADALAAAVERLRARVSAVEESQPAPVTVLPTGPAAAPATAAAPALECPRHRHSVSAIARWRERLRKRRKQRQAA